MRATKCILIFSSLFTSSKETDDVIIIFPISAYMKPQPCHTQIADYSVKLVGPYTDRYSIIYSYSNN